MPTAENLPQPLRISAPGIALLQHFTPFCPTPIKTDCGLEEIGYGHVLRPVDQHLTRVNEAQAEQLLREDVRVFEIYLRATMRVPLQQHQFEALISLVWDVGILAFERSSIRWLLNAGKVGEAVELWRTWDGGPLSPRPGAENLTRRQFETALFCHGGTTSGWIL